MKEDNGACTMITLTMEMMAVTKTLAWLETQNFAHVCFLSNSVTMLRKIKLGWAQSQWLESLRWSRLTEISFIFCARVCRC